MTEYIKREDALKIADEFYDHPIGKGIAKSIFCLPAADVVEVVRCKDCDMAKSGSDEREMYCTFDHCYKGKNYFCAGGRRKNEDSN